MEFDVEDFLRKAVSIAASDVHLAVGEHPTVRKDGKIMKINMPILTDDDLDHAYEVLLPRSAKDNLEMFMTLTLLTKSRDFLVLGLI